jgi:hypothetical protein
MQTKAKANSVITHRVSEDGKVITFVVLGAGEVNLDTTKLHDAIKERAAVHGLIQRGSDRAAIGRDSETGASATPEEKRASIQAWVDHVESGTAEWRMTGTGEGGGKSLTIEAIAQVKGISYEAAEAEVVKFAEKRNESTKAILAFLRKGEKVMRAMEAIRARRQGAPKVDADEALQEMGVE